MLQKYEKLGKYFPYCTRHRAITTSDRLSRARRTTENAIVIPSNQFKMFCLKSYLKPETGKKILIACHWLHNFCVASYTATAFSEEIIETGGIIEGQWSNGNSSPYIQAFQLPEQGTLKMQKISEICLENTFLGWDRYHGNRNSVI